jgi:glycosyltransferase involved in cell wall biosynthesis
MKKLVYITQRKTNILSNFANSKQVYNTCREISIAHSNFEVFLNRQTVNSNKKFISQIKNKYSELNFNVSSTYNIIIFQNDLIYGLYVSIRYLFKDYIFFTRHDWSALFLTLLGKRVYFEAHDFNAKRLCLRIMKKIVNNNNRLSIITISMALKNEFINNNFQNSINVIHDGVDLKKFLHKDKNKARSNLKISFDEKIVLYSGALRPGRGIMRLIDIAKCNNDIKFLVFGGRDAERFQYLKKITTDIDNIFFMGYKKEAELIEYMNAADIFIMPHEENCDIIKYTSPLKMFEYLSIGKPIVASNFPVFKEILVDKKNALLAKYNSTEDFSEKINYLLIDKKAYNSISKNAIDSVQSYSWESRAKNILKVIYEKN